MEFSEFWLWIGAGLFLLVCIGSSIYGSWIFVARCLDLMPTHAYTMPCQLAMAHDFLYRPFLPWGLDQELLRMMLPALERGGYVVGIEISGYCYCTRAYRKLPPPPPKRVENPLTESGAAPAPA